MSVYIVTHKDYIFPNDGYYLPIQVGNVFNNDLLSDNSLDNISSKNKNYCELTALYWIWKNIKEENIGLVHYRRYFTVSEEDGLDFNGVYIPNKHYIDGVLEKFDLILPEKVDLKIPMYRHWGRCHNIDDWVNIGKIINQIYPEYIESYNKVSQSNSLFLYNMFLGKKEIIDSYCAWLFDILFLYEKQLDIDSYESYQSRIYGFLSERLFNVWVEHNKLNVFYKNVDFMEEKIPSPNNIIKRCKKMLCNFISDVRSFGKFIVNINFS